MPKPRPLIRTYAIYGGQIGLLLVVVLLSFATNAGFAFQQHFFGMGFDELREGRLVTVAEDGALDTGRAWFWVGWLLVIAGSRGLLSYISQVAGMLLGQRLLYRLRDRVLGQVQRLDQAWHRRHGHGEIVTRATRDADKVRDAVIIGTRQLLDVALMMLSVVGLLFWYHPLLGSVPALCIAIGIWLNLRYADRLVALNRHADDAYDSLTQDLTETVSGVRVVKAFRLEHQRLTSFGQHLASFIARATHALRWSSLRLPWPQAIVAVGHGWVLTCGGWLAGTGRISPGYFLVGLMLMTGVIFRFEMVSRAVRLFADARASAGRLWELLDAEPSVVGGSASVPDGALGLKLDGVSVHEDGSPVLHDLDLQLEPGSTVALVGATGSGKSTLASLLPRLRDPSTGQVQLCGADGVWTALPDYDLASLRRRVQVVAQDSFLFSDTIRANLVMADPDADEERLWAMLNAADAADFVRALPDGLDTLVGERGVTLSGGQRQRLCLARALIARPGLLILDDATSAVDALTERRILRALSDHGGGTDPEKPA